MIVTEEIPLKKLVPNKGQIKGLPSNARHIKKRQFELLMKSVHEDPEMVEMKPLWVYPQAGRFVIIAGEQRYKAYKKLMYRSAPCIIIPPETTPEKLRALSIKDNHQNGEWDFDLIANEWDLSEILNFGIELPFISHGIPPEKEQKEKTVICPHCGEEFTLSNKVNHDSKKKGETDG